MIQHRVKLAEETNMCKPYFLPYAMREELRNEVEVGVVRLSTSP